MSVTLIHSKIMINEKQVRTLLKKAGNKFISKTTLSRILEVNSKEAAEILVYLENRGFIEAAKIDGYWQQSLRGKLLLNKKFKKEYKMETLKKHLSDLIERAETVNSSKKFPERITCMKVISEYPIINRSNGIHIIYSLSRKEITEKEYDLAAGKLRKEHGRGFGNIVEYYSYPKEAIRSFLKSRSHVLKLRTDTKDEIEQIAGYKLFGED
ncbi:hypothetical protein GFS24_09790 [Chitinophaga sp. SYP-B3965]|uniref:hypothetical protein n=1 Tax=Chitinophaga sp. SYP-B3965 TaxID=2663120 RepID=UPI001299DA05|nr:hypothetical protein [Chitinophaga sp. SYP-B3965]MRG45407.1 hypothetical protein [Chitinophaga sp. SYP-B3965]